MAHTEGHKMVMGSKEKNTPGNFSAVATDLINSAPQSKLRYSDGSMDGDTRGISAGKGSLKPLKVNVSGLGNTGSQKSDYTKGYLKGIEYGQNKKKIDRKAKKEERVANRAANRADRIEGRLAKTQRKGEKATEAGKLQKAKRLQARKQRLLKRQK